MGMTIEEIISVLDDMKVKIDIPKAAVMQNNKNYALDAAIDTMRKYQKIQEIINNTDYIQEDVIRYKMICGVIEDGNYD